MWNIILILISVLQCDVIGSLSSNEGTKIPSQAIDNVRRSYRASSPHRFRFQSSMMCRYAAVAEMEFAYHTPLMSEASV